MSFCQYLRAVERNAYAVRIQIYKHTTVICTEYRTHGAEYTTHGARGFMISKHATPPTSPTAAASANRHIVRIARRILRRAPLGRFPLRRVHSQEDERGDGDIRRHGLARRRARRRRERTTHCSGCPNELPSPETQPVRPKHQIRCAVMQAASCPHSYLGDGQREGDARRLGLGRVRCRAPVVNCSSSAPLVVTWIS